MSVEIRPYRDENDLPAIQKLMAAHLSEPYSIYTYRYFLVTWGKLSHVAVVEGEVVGAVICRLARHKRGPLRGYIGMLAVSEDHRKKGIGTMLVKASVEAMKEAGADEIVLEAETSNLGALRIYESLGFLRDKLLERYYLSGVSAWRLKLWLK
ncbi:N-alpha-acetyltransferase 30 [Salpingoeca rosetta]|uniref:N-alpha-acetyltransferase 30 n=1 Tax=Salpingoeca rosetta (strain ATCC 50818 / BSB-021) TaxID=946362 RepID=F2U892_SALR5|nr:N-alpha-acetyltransferase 30 [Salpingoeca rosetta]EGD72600.1 N-alpha-acetyltransferase 30 [Salpingoeca rosetta]|eukprot:XP_004994423.1 N-alpha-acetyltransferase 30 [Salpingoeca rosetta]